MCGIVGLYSPGSAAAPQRAELEAMAAALRHRGPDGEGVRVDGAIGLGHTRLSIIDLEGGAQPLSNEDATVWVVFNGEIFNYVELRRELLAAGHRLRTESDTEVIVHLYEELGERFVERLNGQFAIALWDQARQRLVLARDRVGIRPLFYTRAGPRLAFASEVKSLIAGRTIVPRLSAAALSQVFTYWAPLPGTTVFEGVEALPPGHVLVAERGAVTVRRYWDWTFADSGADRARSVDDYAAELRDLLIESVRLQLRADVPVGAYLSGGLDSAIISSIIHRLSDARLRTFSLTFDDAEFDESGYQQEMVRFLGAEHTQLRVSRDAIGRAFPRAIAHIESPIVRTAPVPLMLLSGLVRESGYKVVLTGEGADEVFAGYDIYREAKIRRWLARSPASAWRPRLLERLYPYLKSSPTRGGAFSRSFFTQGAEHLHQPYYAHVPRWTTTQRIWQFFRPEVRRALGPPGDFAALAALLPGGIGSWPALGQDQYVEAQTLLSGYLLCSQGDRVAMANSVEGRFPFLDHRVIEFAERVPPRFLVRGLTEKYLLRKALERDVPASILHRQKQPYRAPDSQSFFSDGKPLDYVEELLGAARVDDAGYFDSAPVTKLFDKCRAGRVIGFADNMAFVGILSTMLLHDRFVANPRRAAEAA
jgi:asparagine synthase (glutamine-hydrolysing)